MAGPGLKPVSLGHMPKSMHINTISQGTTVTAPPPIKYETKSLIFKLLLNSRIQECLCHIKALDLVSVLLESYPIRCWARRGRKKSKFDGQRNKRLLSLPPGSSSQSIVHALIFLFKSLEIPLALDRVKDCSLFPAPGTQFQRCKLWWRHFYTLNINIRSQKEYQVEWVWCITDNLSGKGNVLIWSQLSVQKVWLQTQPMESLSLQQVFLHLFTHTCKQTNMNWASCGPEFALEAEDIAMGKMTSMFMNLPG